MNKLLFISSIYITFRFRIIVSSDSFLPSPFTPTAIFTYHFVPEIVRREAFAYGTLGKFIH